VADIYSCSKKQREPSLNKRVQNFLYSMMQDQNEMLVKRALHVMIDLFRRKVWRDSRSVNVIASGVFHRSSAVCLIAAQFLLDSDHVVANDSDESEDESDDQAPPGAAANSDGGNHRKMVMNAFKRSQKKGTRNKRKLERAISKAGKPKKFKAGANADLATSSAMMLIHDPQEFTEKLFSELQTKRKAERFETKLILLNLISRLIGANQLSLLNFYPYLERYLRPYQENVTMCLAYIAQACHDQVPPDALAPVIRSLADNFVSDRCSSESMAAGLNTIRNICARVPLAIEDDEESGESALLQELVEFKGHRDKGVAMAGRGLLQLFREINPALLKRKDRGRDANTAGAVLQKPVFGQNKTTFGVDGAEFLDSESGDGIDLADDASDGSEVLPIQGGIAGDIAESENTDCEGGNLDEVVESGKCSDEEMESEGSDGDDDDDGEDEEDGEENSAADEDDDQGDCELGLKAADDDGPAEVVARPRRVDMDRILGNEDFERIDERKAENLVKSTFADPSRRVTESDVQSQSKKQRQTLEERLASVRAGREGRVKFGSKKSRRAKTGGSSNAQKAKAKQVAMVGQKKRRETGRAAGPRFKKRNKAFGQEKKKQ